MILTPHAESSLWLFSFEMEKQRGVWVYFLARFESMGRVQSPEVMTWSMRFVCIERESMSLILCLADRPELEIMMIGF